MAAELGTAIVTKDEDFVHLRGIDPAGPVVVWVRLGNTTRRALLDPFAGVWPHLEHALSAGERLAGALAYDRIAGFFSSSILEVAGEALESMAGPVRMVCNSVVDPRDVRTAQRAASAAPWKPAGAPWSAC
ncbi:MAG: hypothetical protein GVY09_19295 [Gammaproteobacteria bacterium]|jgi:hypothetical protein|nr:hypothetical protein [Gammaproteobacteria bacterium]